MEETTKTQRRYEVSGWTPDGDYDTAAVWADSLDAAIAEVSTPGYGRAQIIEVGDVADITP